MYERNKILFKIEEREMSQKIPIGEEKIKQFSNEKFCSTSFYSVFKKSIMMNNESFRNFFLVRRGKEQKHIEKNNKIT